MASLNHHGDEDKEDEGEKMKYDEEENEDNPKWYR